MFILIAGHSRQLNDTFCILFAFQELEVDITKKITDIFIVWQSYPGLFLVRCLYVLPVSTWIYSDYSSLLKNAK